MDEKLAGGSTDSAEKAYNEAWGTFRLERRRWFFITKERTIESFKSDSSAAVWATSHFGSYDLVLDRGAVVLLIWTKKFVYARPNRRKQKFRVCQFLLGKRLVWLAISPGQEIFLFDKQKTETPKLAT